MTDASKRVRKAVIPAAGLGTRFLPATKSIPKEMLPIVDKPSIQYVVEEAVAAGIEDILIITSPSKRAVEDHFDRNAELELLLEQRGKTAMLEQSIAIANMVKMHFTRQGQPLGLGHAIGMAKEHVGDEPFAGLLPDDLMVDNGALLSRMINLQAETGGIVVAAGEYPIEEVVAYGVIDPISVEDGVITVGSVVEKPAIADAPSNYGLTGRYVFPPEIFDEIDRTVPGVGGEIQITDAIDALRETKGLKACLYDGGRFDTGQKLDWLRATVEMALIHPDLGEDFAALLTRLVKEKGLA